jgi:hypothetical protein
VAPLQAADPRRAGGTIELKLRHVAQLFNSLDPSPFPEKDLDQDAEDFIVAWAQELPAHGPLHLVIGVEEPLPPGQTEATIEEAVRHYFTYRAGATRLELMQLLRRGRTSLVIGVTFLSVCLVLGEFITRVSRGALLGIPREGLTIGGWVALWRPMEIYLYDWWPIRRRWRLFDRLSRMRVELRAPS